jgi:hypothetical protein
VFAEAREEAGIGKKEIAQHEHHTAGGDVIHPDRDYASTKWIVKRDIKEDNKES